MKYKIGDKVRIRSDLEAGKSYGIAGFTEEMEYLNGNIVTIHNVDTLKGCYSIEIDTYELLDCKFTDEMLLPVTFTKSDLKTGMIAEYRNGDRRLVVGNALIDNKGDEANDLTDAMYKNDLTRSIDNNQLDISKVYEVIPIFHGDLYGLFRYTDNLILIWEREEPPKKMTVAEIEKALGHKVEVVAEEAK